MRDPYKELLEWENLKICFVPQRIRVIKTGNPIVDDVFTRIIHWSNGPVSLQMTIKKFLYCASNDNWMFYEFSNFELNYLKWYVGQYIAGLFHQPLRWDEELDKIKTPKQLSEFILELLKYSIDPL